MDLQLRGRTALITGASRGIGRQVALSLAAQGVAVGICGRDEDALSAVATQVRAHGVACAPVVADLQHRDECARVVAETVHALGRLDILVNNAAAKPARATPRFDDLDDSELVAYLNGKALTALRCTQEALPYLRASDNGRIVLVGGISARVAVSDPQTPALWTGSGIANAAVANFAKHLAARLLNESVTVNVVHPGATRTDRHAANPVAGRMVEPTDVANLVLFLCSPLAAAISGQAIAVDRGLAPVVVY